MLFGRFVPWQSRPGEGFDRRIGHAWLSSGWKSSKKNASCWRLILVYERPAHLLVFSMHLTNMINYENKNQTG